MECPYIDKRIQESSFNRKITYGGYTYWEHTDPDGVKTLVQFCQKKGRKRDVFECLYDWKYCDTYRFLKFLAITEGRSDA